MRYDELAFMNLQLAGMLRSGIPLEGALKQLSASMRRGALRQSVQGLEADLERGLPLRESLARQPLPDLYRRLLQVGAAGNDLPGILTLLADHYQRVSAIGARLKGLLVYPTIVVFASLGLSIFLALFFHNFSREMPGLLTDVGTDVRVLPGHTFLIWVPVGLLGASSIFLLLMFAVPALRRTMRWHLPGFREAALAQLASAMRLFLLGGTNLADALGLLRHLESDSPVGRDIAFWQEQLAQGRGRFSDLAEGSRVVPPLFFWLVNSGGEDLAQGFLRAAEIYQARASYRTEMLLYAALPVSILFLGGMLVTQAYPVFRLIVQFGTLIDQLGL